MKIISCSPSDDLVWGLFKAQGRRAQDSSLLFLHFDCLLTPITCFQCVEHEQQQCDYISTQLISSLVHNRLPVTLKASFINYSQIYT